MSTEDGTGARFEDGGLAIDVQVTDANGAHTLSLDLGSFGRIDLRQSQGISLRTLLAQAQGFATHKGALVIQRREQAAKKAEDESKRVERLEVEEAEERRRVAEEARVRAEAAAAEAAAAEAAAAPTEPEEPVLGDQGDQGAEGESPPETTEDTPQPTEVLPDMGNKASGADPATTP